MSSILNALKKLENDKKINKPGQMAINAGILQEKTAGILSRTTMCLVSAGLFVGGCGATYYVMKHSAAPPVVISPGATVNQPDPRRATTPLQKSIEVQSRPPVQVSQKNPVTSPAQTRVLPAINPVAKPYQPVQQQEREPVAVLKAVSDPALPVKAITRPSLVINGIAFQEGSSENLAVINGVTVSNGNVIEGVMVEDIQKDRIRFSQGGESFEITLNKVNR
jgi:general secretion pathway protein B